MINSKSNYSRKYLFTAVRTHENLNITRQMWTTMSFNANSPFPRLRKCPQSICKEQRSPIRPDNFPEQPGRWFCLKKVRRKKSDRCKSIWGAKWTNNVSYLSDQCKNKGVQDTGDGEKLSKIERRAWAGRFMGLRFLFQKRIFAKVVYFGKICFDDVRKITFINSPYYVF